MSIYLGNTLIAGLNGNSVEKSTTNGILKKQVSESHHPIIENNSVLLYEWLPDMGSKVIYTRTLQLEAGYSIFDENGMPIGEVVSVDNDTQITVTGDVDGSDYTYYGDTIKSGTLVLKAGSKLYVGGSLGTITTEEDLDISDAGEMPEGTKDYAIVLYDYGSEIYDIIGGVPVEVLGKPPHEYYMTTVCYKLNVFGPEYKPVFSSTLWSATLPICIVRTDGTVEPYIKDVYQIGDTCLVLKDSLKVSIPNGRNTDGTLNNLIVSSTDSVLTDISGTDKIYIDSTGALQKSSNCEYNQQENYNKADGSNVLYAKIGDFSSIDDVIQVATKEDLKSVVNYNNISNCITHIPNDIKLELNNGTLTLKAGSKVYVPNGFEEDGTTPYFDEVVIESDLTVTDTGNRIVWFAYRPDSHSLTAAVSSETGAPVSGTYKIYYDSGENKCFVSYASNYKQTSFPICIIKSSTTGITSIDQVFNGFGYIGSTIFALPGVKFLVPNGRNPDGTLQNIEFTLTKNTTSTIGTDFKDRHNQPIWFDLNGKSVAPKGFTFSFGNYSNTNYDIAYDADLNKHFYRSSGNYEEISGCFVGFSSIDTNAKYTIFKPRNTFQAVDLNTNRTVVASYKKGNNWYRIWSDGWKEQGGELTGTIANTLTHTFLIPFTQRPTVLHTQITIWGSCGYIYRLSALELTKISFANHTGYSATGNGKNGTIWWYACGY